MNQIIVLLSLSILLFLSGCITSNLVTDDNQFDNKYIDSNKPIYIDYNNLNSNTQELDYQQDNNNNNINNNNKSDFNVKQEEETCGVPIFTHHITDVTKIKNIVTPPVIMGTDLKTHSYVDTDHERVPVYAPTDMTLFTGSYYKVGPYRFDFKINCRFMLRYMHITEPLQKLKDVFPDEPADESKNQDIKYEIEFKAGDLIGYTTGTPQAGNWDFGVYDLNTQNYFINDLNYNTSQIYTTAVCPYDYFVLELKKEYTKKFNLIKHSGASYELEPFCK